MEILQFLLYFFLSEYGEESLSPLLETYKQVNFNIYDFFKALTYKDLIPLVSLIIKGQKKRSEPERFSNFDVIKNIANNEILENLQALLSLS